MSNKNSGSDHVISLGFLKSSPRSYTGSATSPRPKAVNTPAPHADADDPKEMAKTFLAQTPIPPDKRSGPVLFEGFVDPHDLFGF